MYDPLEFIELEIEPIPPDTISSLRADIRPLTERILRDEGKVGLIEKKDIIINIGEPFPTDQAIIVGLTFLSAIALETFKKVILPEWEKRYKVSKKKKSRKK